MGAVRTTYGVFALAVEPAANEDWFVFTDKLNNLPAEGPVGSLSCGRYGDAGQNYLYIRESGGEVEPGFARLLTATLRQRANWSLALSDVAEKLGAVLTDGLPGWYVLNSES